MAHDVGVDVVNSSAALSGVFYNHINGVFGIFAALAAMSPEERAAALALERRMK